MTGEKHECLVTKITFHLANSNLLKDNPLQCSHNLIGISLQITTRTFLK